MLMLISPAKSLDFESPLATQTHTQPDFLPQSQQLIDELRELSPPAIQTLMKISPQLADLNFGRFLNWQTPFTQDNSRQALLAFTGDVYQGLDVSSFSEEDFNFTQQHLRILSGLYGVLKPLDLMQPYRLEMGTKFANSQGKNLYEFWGEQVTDYLNQQLAAQGADTLVNLASNEYYKSVKPKLLNATIVTPVFKDFKNDQYKIISFYAKKARGMMAAYIIKNRITDDQSIKDFDIGGYYFSAEASSDKEWVFLRDGAE
ncbi:Uncharacterised protein [BD1-7 clade bacterium]|uniref:UPF0246 protein DPBNPPHM_00529 n=1 Tax=BD1-7 clade bacterium TaxID=2029982 RepID=A0A5S9MYH0_9GAMM|nr:Uncharacterised protein [BD1-7 clade bacterium]CAA0082986.1 Uncharacterised protein [BD1-7 clade bacterium]